MELSAYTSGRTGHGGEGFENKKCGYSLSWQMPFLGGAPHFSDASAANGYDVWRHATRSMALLEFQ